MEKRVRNCPDCSVKMEISKINLKVGGFIFGRLGDINEDTFPVVVYTCPHCGKLEFFAVNKIKVCVCGHSKEQH